MSQLRKEFKLVIKFCKYLQDPAGFLFLLFSLLTIRVLLDIYVFQFNRFQMRALKLLTKIVYNFLSFKFGHVYFYFCFSILISLIHAFFLFYNQIYRSISICITYFKEYAFLLTFLCFNVWTEVPPRIGTEKGLGPLDCVPIWYAHWAEQRGNFFKTKLKKITFRIYSTY